MELCNIMDKCATNNHRFVVMKSIKPSASILGVPLRKDFYNKPIKIFSSSYLATNTDTDSSGNITITREGLRYTWDIIENTGKIRADILSTSKIPSILIIPPYTLDVNKMYSIRLTVYSVKYDSTSVVSVRTLVKRSKIISRIGGGIDRYV